MQYNQVNNIHVFLGTFVDKSYHILLPLFFSTFMLLSIVGCSEVALSPEPVVIDTNSSELKIGVIVMPMPNSGLNNDIFGSPTPIDQYLDINNGNVSTILEFNGEDSNRSSELLIGENLLDKLVLESQKTGIACTNTSQGPFGVITYDSLSENAKELAIEDGSCGQGTCVGPMGGPETSCLSEVYGVCALIITSNSDGFETNECLE